MKLVFLPLVAGNFHRFAGSPASDGGKDKKLKPGSPKGESQDPADTPISPLQVVFQRSHTISLTGCAAKLQNKNLENRNFYYILKKNEKRT